MGQLLKKIEALFEELCFLGEEYIPFTASTPDLGYVFFEGKSLKRQLVNLVKEFPHNMINITIEDSYPYNKKHLENQLKRLLYLIDLSVRGIEYECDEPTCKNIFVSFTRNKPGYLCPYHRKEN